MCFDRVQVVEPGSFLEAMKVTVCPMDDLTRRRAGNAGMAKRCLMNSVLQVDDVHLCEPYRGSGPMRWRVLDVQPPSSEAIVTLDTVFEVVPPTDDFPYTRIDVGRLSGNITR